MVFLSATRGWIISLSLILLLAFILALPRNTKQITGLGLTLALFFLLGFSNSKIRDQAVYSFKRLSTLEAFTEGDISAEGTLYRLSVRGPKVMSKWEEDPIFGWDFSKPENTVTAMWEIRICMMTTGIGFILITGFLIHFSVKLFLRYLRMPRSNINRNSIPVFLIFLQGAHHSLNERSAIQCHGPAFAGHSPGCFLQPGVFTDRTNQSAIYERIMFKKTLPSARRDTQSIIFCFQYSPRCQKLLRFLKLMPAWEVRAYG